MSGYIEGIAYFKKNKKESLDIMRKKLRIQSEQERDNRYLDSPTICSRPRTLMFPIPR